MQTFSYTEPMLFYDRMTDKYFKTTMNDVDRCITAINKDFMGAICLPGIFLCMEDALTRISNDLVMPVRTDFYRALYEPNLPAYKVNYDATVVMTENGEPCVAIWWLFYHN